jgi:broad specificity phosphatase PhoE
MTRALQTVALIAAKLSLPRSVEFDLRERLVDRSYSWIDTPAREAIEQFTTAQGEWPVGQPQPWEPLFEEPAELGEQELRWWRRLLEDCLGEPSRHVVGLA